MLNRLAEVFWYFQSGSSQFADGTEGWLTHSGSSLKSHTFLHNYDRETPKREWDQKKKFSPFHPFLWVGLHYLRISWGLSGLLSSSCCKQCFSLLFWGWSKPRASHVNCSWGILQLCLLYPQGTTYTNKREQEENLCGKALMSCAEAPHIIWYVNRGITHYAVRKKNCFYYNEYRVSWKWLHNPGFSSGSLSPISAMLL